MAKTDAMPVRFTRADRKPGLLSVLEQLSCGVQPRGNPSRAVRSAMASTEAMARSRSASSGS